MKPLAHLPCGFDLRFASGRTCSGWRCGLPLWMCLFGIRRKRRESVTGSIGVVDVAHDSCFGITLSGL